MTTNVDRMFTPGGLAVALGLGIEPTVGIGDATTGVTVSHDDLSCRRCRRPIDVSWASPGLSLAVNKRFNDGLCRRCDPVIGPCAPTDGGGR